MWEYEIIEYKNYLKLERSLSDNSISAYINDVKKLTAYLEIEGNSDINCSNLDFEILKKFIEYLYKLGISSHTQARIISGLKSFFNYLIIEEKISVNPMELIQSPKLNKKLPDTLSLDEIDKILNAIDMGTYEENLFLDIGFVKVLGKGSKERLVPIGSSAIKFINMYINEYRKSMKIIGGNEGFLFLNRRGKKLTRNMMFLIIKELSRKINLQKNVSPHTFRHSFATHMIEGGADLRAVQDMLGHESITTTEIYTHLNKEYLREVVKKFHPRS